MRSPDGNELTFAFPEQQAEAQAAITKNKSTVKFNETTKFADKKKPVSQFFYEMLKVY